MKKMGSFVWFPCFVSELWSLNCPKKYVFYNFVLTSARNLGLLKQFIDMYLKELIRLVPLTFGIPQFTCDLFLEICSIEGKKPCPREPSLFTKF